jgi:aspartate/methionine/tyrosine aminotransferase
MKSFSHPSTPHLKYGIREIVDVAGKLKEIDPAYDFVWENIGDPIAKGWPAPQFLKDIIKEEINRPGDAVFGYSHSRGALDARIWVVESAKRFSPSSKLDYENVVFTSGLGSAIAILYQMLKNGGRVIQPAPAYPSHSSFESFSANAAPIAYNLDPNNNWRPDLAHLEKQLQTHPEVIGLLVINPNNPTGAVYDEETLEKIVTLAEKHHLFIISDEVYFRMIYNGRTHVQITEINRGRVPLIILRGLSKDIPWPGGRCGWIEFHYTSGQTAFAEFAAAVKQRMLLEVCATTLPQIILPKLYEHPDFEVWNKQYNQGLETAANQITNILASSPALQVIRANGAFYLMPLFKEGVLNNRQTLPVKNLKTKEYIESLTGSASLPLDKRFTYYLLANTGIVTVPASDFYSPFPGFRVTTLDRDPARRKNTYTRLVNAVTQYIQS